MVGSTFVVDASAVLAVVLNEPEKRPLIRLTVNAVLLAPGCLPWEVGSALSAMIRRKRIGHAAALQAVEVFEAIPIRYGPVDLGRALRLAADTGLYAYDAYYLECSFRQKAPLLTLDRRLRQCAVGLGILAPEVTP